MKKVKLSQADIDANPLLKKIGAKAGQTMEYSFVTSSKSQPNASTQNTDEGDNEGGEGDGEDGENHPTKKPKN
jgi:hypothetical protein